MRRRRSARSPSSSFIRARMSAHLARIYAHPSALLRIAAHAQHLRRWEIPRADFPPGRHGYNDWRKRCRIHHADLAGAHHAGASATARRTRRACRLSHQKRATEKRPGVAGARKCRGGCLSGLLLRRILGQIYRLRRRQDRRHPRQDAVQDVAARPRRRARAVARPSAPARSSRRRSRGNPPRSRASPRSRSTERMDVTSAIHLIVGGGLAGVFCALKLAPRPSRSSRRMASVAAASSFWAQGGVAAAVSEGDTPEIHAADTARRRRRTCRRGYGARRRARGARAVDDLLAFGVPFDRDDAGRARPLARGGAFASPHRARQRRRRRTRNHGRARRGRVAHAARSAVVEGEIARSNRHARRTRDRRAWRATTTARPRFSRPRRRSCSRPAAIGRLYRVTTNPPRTLAAKASPWRREPGR